MIKIKDISISFDGQNILNKINLSIPQNQITNIVGASGSGKSVLMKIVDGLIIPDSGSVFIDEIDIFSLNRKELNSIRRKIAMLFQGSALLDSLNVFQNIALPLIEHSNLTEDALKKEVQDKLELVGLTGSEYKKPAELSGGMKKRVALARAIILKPDYVIYDEPTTGLDPIMSDEILRLIKRMQEKYQITSIVISHDLNCINKLKGKVAMLHQNKIIFDGKYEEFINAQSKVINKFLGKRDEILSK